jgi:hypothetical protein
MALDEDAYIFGSEKADTWAGPLYLVFFILAILLLVLQLWKLRRLMLVSSLVCLPLLTISLAYENFLLYISCTTNDISAGAVGAGYVFQAMVIPLMMIVLHEVTYRLHEYRNVHFLWFPLEVNGENDGAEAVLWINRLIALTFFILGLAVAFNWWGLDNKDPLYVGSGGYAYLQGNTGSAALWISLVPSLWLCVMALSVGSFLYKYGVYVALTHNAQWKLIYFCVVVIVASHSFSHNAYPVTSNAGELLFLMSLTSLVYFVQEELSTAASFADFLRRNNNAFEQLEVEKNRVKQQSDVEMANVPGRRAPASNFVASRIKRGGSPDLKALKVDSESANEGDEEMGAEQVGLEMTDSSSPERLVNLEQY